jgi:hypothetical protein
MDRATMPRATVHPAAKRLASMGRARARRPKSAPGAASLPIAAPDLVRRRSSYANRGGVSFAHSTTTLASQPLARRPTKEFPQPAAA